VHRFHWVVVNCNEIAVVKHVRDLKVKVKSVGGFNRVSVPDPLIVQPLASLTVYVYG
jgi:hypothetical protein